MRYLVLVLAALTFVSGLASARTIVHCGTLIDGVNDIPVNEMSVIIEDGKFAAVEEGYAQPADGDEVIDLKSHTVMPGWFDMHTHLSFQYHQNVKADPFFLEPQDIAFRSVPYAERTLMAGFTTCRDLGDDGNTVRAMRDAINRGYIVGPRIYTAGKSIATTGGHADPTNGWVDRVKGDPGPDQGVINGPRDVWKAVRQRYKDGSDCIKITATGGVLSLAKSGQNPQFTDEELASLMEAAHDYGFTVAVHAHGAEGMLRAVVAGVDSIEHGTYMTDEIMREMKKRGTYLVPTLMAGDWCVEKAKEEGFFPEIVRPKAATIGPVMEGTFRKAYEAGVPIAFGTDSGVTHHGENAYEFVLMERGGMPPMEIIQAATMSAAKLMRVQDILGSVEAGKIADLVAVPGDPLKGMDIMKDVSFVMKDGTVYKHE